MSSFGADIYDAAGNLVLEISARYLRLVHTQVVTGNGSINLPDIANVQTFQWIDIGYSTWTAAQGNLTVMRSGSLISWTLPSGVSISAPLYVFAYS